MVQGPVGSLSGAFVSVNSFFCFLNSFSNVFLIKFYVLILVLDLFGCVHFYLVAASEGYSSLWGTGFSLRWLLLFL